MENTDQNTIHTLPQIPNFQDLIRHTRKNHALEHATIHILNEKNPRKAFGGYSINKGFWIFGKAEIQEIQEAVDIAYARLNNGEKKLAVHPACGTNLVVTGLCSAISSLIVLSRTKNDKERISRFSALMLAGALGNYVGTPLGMKVQKYLTTDPDVSSLSVLSITSSDFQENPFFFVKTNLN